MMNGHEPESNGRIRAILTPVASAYAMRVEQHLGIRGSLKWIQRLADQHPGILNEPLRRAGALAAGSHLKWLSPRRDDAWAEYRDEGFLEKIGQQRLAAELKGFWPRRGPQWDALAAAPTGRVFLIEVKAHIPEMTSHCEAGSVTLPVIARALNRTKQWMGVTPDADWLNGYYQYACRLAHLSFLQQHGVDCRLVFLYFTGDADMRGPPSEGGWKPAIKAAQNHLGLSSSTPGVVSIFQSVDDLRLSS